MSCKLSHALKPLNKCYLSHFSTDPCDHRNIAAMVGLRYPLLGGLISTLVGILVNRYSAEDGKILITNGINAMNTWLHPKTPPPPFQNVIDVKLQEDDVAVEFNLKGLLDFKYQHECKVYAKLDAFFYEEVIESIGENLDLDNKTIKSMKLAKHTESAVEAITGISLFILGCYN